jgi:hypothetical protein
MKEVSEISSSHGGEYDVQNCLLGYTAVENDCRPTFQRCVTHPWWWRQYAPLKRWSTIILHGSISQKTILNIERGSSHNGNNKCSQNLVVKPLGNLSHVPRKDWTGSGPVIWRDDHSTTSVAEHKNTYVEFYLLWLSWRGINLCLITGVYNGLIFFICDINHVYIL